MGTSPDSRRRTSEQRTQSTPSQDVTREAKRTIEELRTDVLSRIQHARSARKATPSEHNAHAASQTVEYADEDTVESFPSDTNYRSARSGPQPSADDRVHDQQNQTQWNAGTLIANRYRLLEPLGAGAWGTIWKARQEGIDRFVAIKILKEREPQSMTNARARFEREAKLASRIRHPSAVRVLDFGYRDNQPYLVMEWLQGLTLQSFLRECGPLPPELVVDIGIGICGALHAAHEEGVIHRDLKPSNIMLVETSSGLTPVVVDFGLARTFAPDEPTVTRDDMIVGTPAYMCPESIRGRALTPTSDIYSLGVTFLTALLGENPFRGESGSVTMTNHLLERPVDQETLELIGCSPALASALLAMIALEPEDRPDARRLEFHFQQLLDEFIQGEIPDTHPAAGALDWSDAHDPWTFDTSELSPIASQASAQPRASSPHLPPPRAHKSVAEAHTESAPRTDANIDTPTATSTTADTSNPSEVNNKEATRTPNARVGSPRAWHDRPLRQWAAIVVPFLLIAALAAAFIQQRAHNQQGAHNDATTSTAAVSDTTPLVSHMSSQDFLAEVQGASQELVAVQVSATPPAPTFKDTAPARSNTSRNGDAQTQQARANSPSAADVQRNDAIAAPVATIDGTTTNEDAIANQKAAEDDVAKNSAPASIENAVAEHSSGPLDVSAPPPAAATRTSRTGTSSRRASSKRTSAAAAEPATLVLTLSPPGEVYIGDKAYGMRSSLMLNDIPSGRHTIRVEREEQREERRVRLKPGKRHVESF